MKRFLGLSIASMACFSDFLFLDAFSQSIFKSEMFRLEIFEVFIDLFDTVFRVVLLVTVPDFFSSQNPFAIFALHTCVWAFFFDVSFEMIKASKSSRLTFSVDAADIKIAA